MEIITQGHSFEDAVRQILQLFFDLNASFSVNSQLYAEDDNYKAVTKITLGEKYAEGEIEMKMNLPKKRQLSDLVKKSVFFACKKLSSMPTPWGISTGIRPAKTARMMLDEEKSDEEILSYMEDEFLVTQKKARLSLDVAKKEKELLDGMEQNTVSIYVGIPFCPTRCAYCSFVSQTISSFKKLMPEYVDKLCEEIRYTANLVKDSGFTLDTVYFGGGTPTSLEASDLERIMKTIAECFDTSHLREYTVEAGRPDTVTIEKLNVIKNNGGDRISVNPQTIHDSVLKEIGRAHTAEQFFESYKLAKTIGYKAVNVDLIAGLPTDTYNGFKETVESIIALQPENITIHALSIKRASDLMQTRQISDDELAESMIKYATERLFESGYEPYYLYRQKNQLGNQENIGWTKPGLGGIYNVNIMEEVQTIIAVGAGGTTKIIDGGFERFFNPKYPLEYIKHFDTVLARKEEAAKLLLSAGEADE